MRLTVYRGVQPSCGKVEVLLWSAECGINILAIHLACVNSALCVQSCIVSAVMQ